MWPHASHCHWLDHRVHMGVRSFHCKQCTQGVAITSACSGSTSQWAWLTVCLKLTDVLWLLRLNCHTLNDLKKQAMKMWDLAVVEARSLTGLCRAKWQDCVPSWGWGTAALSNLLEAAEPAAPPSWTPQCHAPELFFHHQLPLHYPFSHLSVSLLRTLVLKGPILIFQDNLLILWLHELYFVQ